MITCIVRGADGVELGCFHPSGKRSLLAEALAAGVAIPHSCRVGICANCACRIIRGGNLLARNRFATEEIPVDRDSLLACCAGVRPELVVSRDEHTIELQTLL